MNGHDELKFEFSSWDIIAIMSSFFTLFYTLLFFPENIFFYVLVIALLLSVVMEKGVQILMIFNVMIYLLLNQIFLSSPQVDSIFDYLLFNISNWTTNISILFISYIFFIVISSLSFLSSVMIVANYKERQDFNVAYATVLTSVLIIVLGLVLSYMLAYDVRPGGIDVMHIRESFGIQEELSGDDYLAAVKMGETLGFYLTIYQFFIIFTIMYYVVFSLVLFSSLSIRVSVIKVKNQKSGVSVKKAKLITMSKQPDAKKSKQKIPTQKKSKVKKTNKGRY